MADYRSRFDTAVAAYPFVRWRQNGLPQYTAAACAAFAAVFDRLIEGLVSLGEAASEPAKLTLIQQAVEALNALNAADETLIETGEREELCALVNRVTAACGLDPAQYSDGEGPAGAWREW
jgi:hypothetical protein